MTSIDLSIPAPRRASLLQRIAAYSASRGVTEGLLGLRGILLATVLGPAGFGAWALLRLSMRYSMFGALGVFRGLELESLAARRRDEPGEGAPAGAALGFILAESGTLAGIALVASFVVPDPSHAMVLRGFAAAVVFEQAYTYALVWTRVRMTLRRYASLEMVNAALQLVCAVSLAAVWGLPGAFGGMALASALALLLAASWVEFRPAIRIAPLRRLLGVGIPLTVSMLLATSLYTADRWIVAAFGGATLLGYYALAASVADVTGSFAWVVRTVVFPDVYGHAQSSGAVAALNRHFDRAVLPFARLYPPLLGALACLLGPVVALAVPQYLPAIAPAKIFLVSGAAAGLVSLAAVGAVAAGRHRSLPFLSAGGLVASVTLSLLAIRLGRGLEAVAGAAFTGQVLYAAGILWLTCREGQRTDTAAFLRSALLPLGWCMTSVLLVGRLFPGNDLASAAPAFLVYLVLILPLAPVIRREWAAVRR
ncbi:MAG: lipopolysaccharide biosynthesis protein [Gemmatimonadales bacterium]